MHGGGPDPYLTQPGTGIGKVQKAIAVVISGFILYYFDFIAVHFSPKVFSVALYPSLALYAVFVGMWIYSSFFLQRKNPMWFQSHQDYIKYATAIVLLASVLWLVGIWPVLHFRSILVFLAAISFISNLSGLMGSLMKPRRKTI